jgi:hypothetical protein
MSKPALISPPTAKEVAVQSQPSSRLVTGAPRSRGSGGPPAKSRSLTLILAIAPFLLLAPATAAAQDCISEITVIYGGNSGIQPPAGYTKINVDLNQGAGGDYIYVCYKKGVGAPITGLAVTLGNAPPPAPVGYTRINVDLNRNAGGDYIWLWYTKDPACATIHNLHVLVNSTTPPAGFTRIPVDLNRNAGGEYIYLCYEEL